MLCRRTGRLQRQQRYLHAGDYWREVGRVGEEEGKWWWGGVGGGVDGGECKPAAAQSVFQNIDEDSCTAGQKSARE